MKGFLRLTFIAAAMLLCMALGASATSSSPYTRYKANLRAVFSGHRLPYGTAVVTIYNDTYAETAFDVRNIVDAIQAHVHNGVLPARTGPVVQFTWQSVLPNTTAAGYHAGTFQPIRGSFAGYTPFDPTATGVGALLAANSAYFNVHTTEYPEGAIQGNFFLWP